MTGYDRTIALRRRIRRRERIRTALLWAAVALYVFGFTLAVSFPLVGWPLLGLAVTAHLGGIK